MTKKKIIWPKVEINPRNGYHAVDIMNLDNPGCRNETIFCGSKKNAEHVVYAFKAGISRFCIENGIKHE